jgi:hypothetical protein
MFSVAGPSTPHHQRQGFAGPEYQATPGSSATATAADDYEASMSFALGEFRDELEVDVPVPEGRSILDLQPTINTRNLQNKRGHDNTSGPETSKRQRKPSAKAKEQDGDIF